MPASASGSRTARSLPPLGQPVDVSIELPRIRIDPLRARDEELERRRRLDVFDADREDRLLLAHGALDLTRDEDRLVARVREHEDQAARALDAPDDLVAIGASRPHIAWRDPAFEAARFEAVCDLLRGLLVGLCIADEGRVGVGACCPFGSQGRSFLDLCPPIMASRWAVSIAARAVRSPPCPVDAP